MTQPIGSLGKSLKIWYYLVLGLFGAAGAVAWLGGGCGIIPGRIVGIGAMATGATTFAPI